MTNRRQHPTPERIKAVEMKLDRRWDRSAAIKLARDTSDTRRPLVLMAQVGASVEACFGECQGWRHPTRARVDLTGSP